MSVNKVFLLLVFISSLAVGSSYGISEWQWSKFRLHNAIGLEDEKLSPEYLKLSLENCLANFIEDICGDADIWLILLSKIDSETESTIDIANRIYNESPDDFEEDLYYLREYSARALARNGQTDKLTEEHEGDDPYLDDVFLLAENNDYSWAHLVLINLDSESPFVFCEGVGYMLPFLSDKFPDKAVFINKLISAVLVENDHKAYCALQRLFDVSLKLENIITMNSYVASLLNASDVYKQKRAATMVNRWPLSMSKDSTLIARMIKIAASSNDNSLRFYLSDAILEMGVIAKHFPRLDPQQASPEDLVVEISYSDDFSFEEYMISHPYNSVWLSYANNMQFTDWQDLLIVLETGKYPFVDSDEKLQFFRESPIVSQSRYLKLQLTKSVADTATGSALLSELFISANDLQKNALIARFPKQLASQSVVSISNTNSWLKLANLTNLLTICNVEVPPVDEELSDPVKLTKYLEHGGSLLEGCTRVSGKF